MKFARHRTAEGQRPIVQGGDGRWRDLTPVTSDLTAQFVAGAGTLDLTVLPEINEARVPARTRRAVGKAKNCETFNPLGPWLVTPDEVPDPQNLGLRLWVNGAQRQNGNTSNMIFRVDYLVWYIWCISQFMVLYPGDVINSGTPAGVAMGMTDTPYLRDGDVVELEIDGLGRQRHAFVQA